MKTVVIRTDASESIGSGHIIRCLVLAEAFRSRNWKTVFISRKLPGNLIHLIKQQAHELIELQLPIKCKPDTVNHDDHLANLVVSQSQDAKETIESIQTLSTKPELLIVDHYSLGRVWESTLREYIHKIFVIDDLAENDHDTDYLLNQDCFSGYNKVQDYLSLQGVKNFLGPKYALLNPAFIDARKKVKRDGSIKKILVFYGGSDISNESGKALSALISLNNTNIGVDVVVGSNNSHGHKLTKCFKSNEKINFHQPLGNLSDLMLNADLLLGAGGSTTMEALCVGLPSIITTTAKNQVPSVKYLHDHGFINHLGAKDDVNKKDIEAIVNRLLDSPEILQDQSARGMNLVDGEGVDRLLSELIEI